MTSSNSRRRPPAATTKRIDGESLIARTADSPHLRARAEQGDPQAQFKLGQCCLLGIEVVQDDRQAGDWFSMAARQSYPPALCEFGTLFEQGRGTGRDLLQAAQLHLAAAGLGNAAAHERLAGYRDELVAMALGGNREAAFDLHRIHAEGLGMCPSEASSWAWIRWAADACPPLPEDLRRMDQLDEEVAAVREFFAVAYDTSIRGAGDTEFRALQKAARSLEQASASGLAAHSKASRRSS